MSFLARVTTSARAGGAAWGRARAALSTSAPSVSGIDDAQARRVEERYGQMRQAHEALVTEFPAHAQPREGEAVDASHAYRKRLVYRSKQRGWLEVDLLMGTFADQHVWEMSEQQLTEYEAILNEETIDIFNFITKKEPVPQELCSDVMDLVQAWCANNPLGTTPEQYADVKRQVPGLT